MNYYEEGKKFRQMYSNVDIWPVSFSSNPDDYRDFLKGIFGYYPLHYSYRERLVLDLKWMLKSFCNIESGIGTVENLYRIAVCQKPWDDFLAQDLEFII